MSSLSSGISSLIPSHTEDVYKASASVEDGKLDASTSTVTGDRTGGLFTDRGNEMQKDDFLLLLVTQLRMQDPLSPMENTEFMTQLAQMRAIESSNNIEKAVENMQESFEKTVAAQEFSAQSTTNAASVSLIGKDVRIRQTDVRLQGPESVPVELRVHLGDNDTAVVNLLDGEGEIVKTLHAGDKDAQNSVELAWDGMLDSGRPAKSGIYRIQIEGEQDDPSLYAFGQDVVQGIRFSADGALIKIGGRELPVGNIMDVSASSPGGAPGGVSPASAVELLGKKIRVARDTVSFSGSPDAPATVKVYLGDRSEATLSIRDAAGRDVARLKAVNSGDGTATVTWNGAGINRQTYVEAGVYSLHLEESENNPWVYAYDEGVVDGLSNVNGNVQIRMNGRIVSLSDIIDISTAAA
ncbi:MAG: hypothetical protein GF398_10765 [Chitinivibrionales bacterium]|nr:hypothetical protein [Chitinivibrionales bacterium]